MTEQFRHTIPRGACDCHVHLFGPAQSYPFAAQRVYTPGDATEYQLDAMHKRLGIDRVVLIQPSVYGTDNARLLAGLARLGPRARAIAVLDGRISDAELEDLDRAGVRGVRVNAATHGVHDPDHVWAVLDENARQLAGSNWHVQVLTRLPVIEALASRIERLPVPLVVDHFALVDPTAGLAVTAFQTLLALVRKGHVVVKMSAIERLTGPHNVPAIIPFIRELMAANPQALLWGSDWPHTGGGRSSRQNAKQIEPFADMDDALALRVLWDAIPDSSLIEQILVSNPARLYGFPAGASDE
ncbi:amidohydrolase family protein [Ancylobacter amanitiformis]|uniref:TIM-barrel fold metal-dependent hydrolase n=1 Tax=Ancylobacter amanitiformis TaxID=217069 RepID=A0ABU0LW49_9HYPH|nr:amidohydrolase family protein [Ancylobacter amanitiformis]MDQ0512926.1 putative TIM-barrel fold metal-dependent hydrolase [Ancylobacter amanitiformis]